MGKCYRILVISHMYPSYADGAYGIFVHKQVLELIKQGCDVRVIRPVPWIPFPISLYVKKWQKKFTKVNDISNIDGVEVYYPEYFALPKGIMIEYSGFIVNWCIKKLVKEIYRDFKFDIIHSHVVLPGGFAGMKLKEDFNNKPLVVTIHGQDLQKTINKNSRCSKAIKQVFQKGNIIITVSSKLKEIAEKKMGYANKIKVINNGIDPKDVFVKNGSENRNCYNRSEDIVILSVSNLFKSKGIDINIKAISKIIRKNKKIKYYIIGDGPEEATLRSLSKSLGLDQNVFFLGRLPHDEVMKYMANTDIFSLPSWEEGFGVVYLEAISFGKPVIACQGEGIIDVIKHGETGILVKPHDIDDLASKLNLLINEPELAKTIGENARELVLASYTWEQNAKKTIAVYEEVLGENS
ncbi:MAG: glycosyltransferase [Bacteroidales bacterium]